MNSHAEPLPLLSPPESESPPEAAPAMDTHFGPVPKLGKEKRRWQFTAAVGRRPRYVAHVWHPDDSKPADTLKRYVVEHLRELEPDELVALENLQPDEYRRQRRELERVLQKAATLPAARRLAREQARAHFERQTPDEIAAAESDI